MKDPNRLVRSNVDEQVNRYNPTNYFALTHCIFVFPYSAEGLSLVNTAISRVRERRLLEKKKKIFFFFKTQRKFLANLYLNLLQELRFSSGTSRSTRQGASFLILMFKINPGSADAVSHLTIWHKINSPRVTGTPIIRRSREFWHSLSPARERHGTYTRTLARLAGDCGLNGTREFTWGRGRAMSHQQSRRLAGRGRNYCWRRWIATRVFSRVRDVTRRCATRRKRVYDSLRMPHHGDAAS